MNLELATFEMEAFLNKYLDELVRNVKDADDYQLGWMLDYLNCARELFIPVEDSVWERFAQSYSRKRMSIQPLGVEFSYRLLELAQHHLDSDRVIQASILVCEALAEFILNLCRFWEPRKRSYYRSAEPLGKQEFPDWLGYLKSYAKISLQQLLKFTFIYRDWCERLDEDNYAKPDPDDVENFLREVRDFIDEKLTEIF